jgi:hypothetical protein
MRDVCLSSIIPQKLHSESICIIRILRILILGAVASLLFGPVSAYMENVSFDGDSYFNLINCSRIVWYIDPSTGHLSLPSLRSGPIQSGGASCVAKEVEGPARINFWWRVDQDASQVGMLVFMVDNETILQCTSSDWSPVDYAVPSGNHSLIWKYSKLRSYPEYAGAGWIDDLQIVYPKEQMPEVLPENASCCGQFPSIGGKIEGLETRVGHLENLSRKQTVGALNISQSDLKELVGRLNLSGLDEERLLRRLDTKIEDVVNKKIENLSFNQTAPSNLSWIWENVVYISNKNNLTKVVNENRNKTILLADGVYHTGELNIITSDVYIKSLRKWGAVLDADNASIGVILDTVNNVTIDSIAITNCTTGLRIENSTNCNIINNNIYFNEVGIFTRNNSQSVFMLNRLDSPGININGFDIGRNDNNNTFAFNNININRSDGTTFQYVVISPAKDNFINILGHGKIKEDDICCRIWDNKFECKWKNDSIANLTHYSNNTWDFLDWDTALINNAERSNR